MVWFYGIPGLNSRTIAPSILLPAHEVLCCGDILLYFFDYTPPPPRRCLYLNNCTVLYIQWISSWASYIQTARSDVLSLCQYTNTEGNVGTVLIRLHACTGKTHTTNDDFEHLPRILILNGYLS